MEEKKNRGMYVGACVLLFLAVLLLVLAGVFFLGGKEDKPGGNGNAGPFVEKEMGAASKSEKQDAEKDIKQDT